MKRNNIGFLDLIQLYVKDLKINPTTSVLILGGVSASDIMFFLHKNIHQRWLELYLPYIHYTSLLSTSTEILLKSLRPYHILSGQYCTPLGTYNLSGTHRPLTTFPFCY